MDEKFLDDNAINTSFGGKSSMELEQSGQNICAAVKGVLGSMLYSSGTTTRTDPMNRAQRSSELMINACSMYRQLIEFFCEMFNPLGLFHHVFD